MTKYHYHDPVDLFIDKNGDWFNNGARVVHEKIFELFNRSLRHDGSGGYLIEVQGDTCPVRVEGTPFVVRGVFFENDENGVDVAWLTMNDGRRERLDPATLRADASGALLCRVFSGVFDAAFSAAAMSQIAPYIEKCETDGRLCIEMNGEKYFFSK